MVTHQRQVTQWRRHNHTAIHIISRDFLTRLIEMKRLIIKSQDLTSSMRSSWDYFGDIFEASGAGDAFCWLLT